MKKNLVVSESDFMRCLEVAFSYGESFGQINTIATLNGDIMNLPNRVHEVADMLDTFLTDIHDENS